MERKGLIQSESQDLTRRGRAFVILAVLVGVMVLLPGCGGGGGGGSSVPTPGPSLIYGPPLSSGFNMGVNTSGGLSDWCTSEPQGFMTCAYPANQQWGSVFIVAGTMTTDVSIRKNL